MASPSDRLPGQLLDLPELIQSLGVQRRSGLLEVRSGNLLRRLRFQQGNLVGMTGDPNLFAKALLWSGLLKPEQLAQILRQLGGSPKPDRLISHLVGQQLASRDGILDAIDMWVEEEFVGILSWSRREMAFVEEDQGDTWFDTLAQLGVSINPGGIILECLRRQDEVNSFAVHLPDPWDVLVRDPAVSLPPEPPADVSLVLAKLGERFRAVQVYEHPSLPPFRAQHVLVFLRRLGYMRLASGTELVVLADAAMSQSRHKEAYGLYRRAVALGLRIPRVHLHIAELAERLGEGESAGRSYLEAASLIEDPSQQVLALRSAIRLGVDREAPLNRLAEVCLGLGEKEEAAACLVELARLYEQRHSYDSAAQALQRAQELGADRVACALMLARVAAAEGDEPQAMLNLELAARSAQMTGRNAEAVEAWDALLAIAPGRCEYAREAADLLVTLGRNAEAMKVLRKAIASATDASEEVLMEVHQLLTRLDPNDAAAHDWLAKAFERQRDRQGATEQLKLVAAAQERGGDVNGLVRTYLRMLELGGDNAAVFSRLAKARLRLGQETAAAVDLVKGADLLLASGQLVPARQLLDEGAKAIPTSLALRQRQAQAALRAGDREAAAIGFRASADLAMGIGDRRAGREALFQLAQLHPDDLVVRVQLAGLLPASGESAVDRILRDVVRCALRTSNLGLAVEHARRRIANAQGLAYEQRLELIALYNRTGDHAAELNAGRQLLDDLLQHAEFDKAVEVLSRMVAGHPDNPDLVLQLAEVQEALGDTRQACRFYRHAVTLLQVEDRLPEARKALEQAARLSEEPLIILRARERLESGAQVDWEQLRGELDHEERRRLAEQIGSGRLSRDVPPGQAGLVE